MRVNLPYQQDPNVGFNETNMRRQQYGMENAGLDRNILNRYITGENASTWANIGGIMSSMRRSNARGGTSNYDPAMIQRTVEAQIAAGHAQNRELFQSVAEMDANLRRQGMAQAAGISGQLYQGSLSREAAMNDMRARELGLQLQNKQIMEAAKARKWGLYGSLFQGAGSLIGGGLGGILGNSALVGGAAAGAATNGVGAATALPGEAVSPALFPGGFRPLQPLPVY